MHFEIKMSDFWSPDSSDRYISTAMCIFNFSLRQISPNMFTWSLRTITVDMSHGRRLISFCIQQSLHFRNSRIILTFPCFLFYFFTARTLYVLSAPDLLQFGRRHFPPAIKSAAWGIWNPVLRYLVYVYCVMKNVRSTSKTIFTLLCGTAVFWNLDSSKTFTIQQSLFWAFLV